MRRTDSRLVGLSLVVLATAAGCGDDESCAQPLRLATFNGGLAMGDVSLWEERMPPQVAALGAADIDLLCVQEYWSYWAELQTATAATLPNQVHLPPMADCATPACSPDEASPLDTCMIAHCDGMTGSDLIGCGSDHCMDLINELSGPCLGCLMENAPGGLPGIRDTCISTDPSAGNSYLYDCSYDTGILTSASIVAQESQPLDSYYVTAAVDFARINTGAGDIDVFCTHLGSAIFDYAGEHGDWKGEQSAQIDQLLAFIADKNDGIRPAVLLGDLNHGPPIAEAGIEGEWPDHYQRLLDAGFVNPYAEQADVECTFCPDNTLLSDDSDPRLVDHILWMNAPAATHTTRLLTESITVNAGGEPVQTHHSDHYGLVSEVDGWCAK